LICDLGRPRSALSFQTKLCALRAYLVSLRLSGTDLNAQALSRRKDREGVSSGDLLKIANQKSEIKNLNDD
jgi:hypothetical protein